MPAATKKKSKKKATKSPATKSPATKSPATKSPAPKKAEKVEEAPTIGLLRRQIEKLRRQNLALASGQEIIQEAVASIYDANPDRFYFDVPAIPRDPKKGRSEEIAVLHISDVHMGKRTKSFDSTVCAQRMEFLTAKVIETTNVRRTHAHIEEIRVYLGGDIIEGESIFAGQAHEIDSSLLEQATINAPEIFVSLCMNLLKTFKKVHLVGIPGNHGRSGNKYSGANPKTNWDRVFYSILRTNLLGSENNPRMDVRDRLTFNEPDDFYAVDRVYDWGNLIFHGDQVRGGFAGFPWYGAAKKLWGYIDLIAQQWDYCYIGHFHTPAELTLNHRILFANGCFESDNDYALEQLAAGGFPQQRLQFFNEQYGMISNHPIWLSTARTPHLLRERLR